MFSINYHRCRAIVTLCCCFSVGTALVAASVEETSLAKPTPISQNQEHMLSEIDAIYRLFELRYAPLEWKKTYLGWDLDTEIAALKNSVLAHPEITQRDFQRLLRAFFVSMQDFHATIHFHSTEHSLLPFRIAFADDRCFVIAIDKEALAYRNIPLAVGDEILGFNQQTPLQMLKQFAKDEYHIYDNLSHKSLAAKCLTSRFAALGHLVPQGKVVLKVRHKGEKKPQKYELEWDYYPEKITHRWLGGQDPAKVHATGTGLPLAATRLGAFFNKTASLPVFETLCSLSQQCSHLNKGQRLNEEVALDEESSLQIFANLVTPGIVGLHNNPKIKYIQRLRSQSHLALIYKTSAGQNIGYIRIPMYYGSYEDIDDFAQIILQMQNATEALVIDQIDNPGGSLFYMYAMASMLTPTPLRTHTYRQTLAPVDVAQALMMQEELLDFCKGMTPQSLAALSQMLGGFHVDESIVNDLCGHCQFIIDEWNRGCWLTQPEPLTGISAVKPHPKVHYSKPIVILVNELAGSCGDLMPALLQDNGRALVLGAKTVGAGGHVLRIPQTSRFGISDYSYTASFGLRLDGKTPIENLGVSPDIEYVMVPDDYQNGYQSYSQAIEMAVKAAMNQGWVDDADQRDCTRLPLGFRGQALPVAAPAA